MSEFEIRTIILPSGRRIEVVYVCADDDAAAGGSELERCPACTAKLVYPLSWLEVAGERWQLELRCPDCEWRGSGEYRHADVERFGQLLDRGSACLLDELAQLTRANMEAELERFAAALAQDLILPCDF